MGIYIGFMVTTLVLLIIYRKKQAGFPPLYIIILSALFIIFAGLDGFLSYTNICKTNNIARIVTGYLSGLGLSVLCYPVFAWQFYKNSRDKKILNNVWHFVILLFTAGIFLIAAILKPAFMGVIFYFLNILAIVFTFIFSNLLIILFIPYFSKKAEKFFSKYLILPLIIGTGFSFSEICLLKLLNTFLTKRF
jgi:uncharacterized membrane protein